MWVIVVGWRGGIRVNFCAVLIVALSSATTLVACCTRVLRHSLLVVLVCYDTLCLSYSLATTLVACRTRLLRHSLPILLVATTLVACRTRLLDTRCLVVIAVTTIVAGRTRLLRHSLPVVLVCYDAHCVSYSFAMTLVACRTRRNS